MTRESIEKEIHRLLVESFEIPRADIRPDANLFEELGLDSLDAIDMLLSMETFVGQRLDDGDKERAKKIRTVDDIVVFVMDLASRSPTN